MRYARYFQSTALYLILICVISSSNAIVLHPGSGQPTGNDKPADAVLGRWSGNASFVVIGLPEKNSANAIITTRHQDTTPNTTPTSVVIDGTTFDLGTIYTTPDNSDIQIAELVGANLANYVPIYTLENPNNPTKDETGEEIVLGGYGKGRGDPVYDDQEQDIIGYKWGGNDNETLRWGTNVIDSIAPDANDNYYLVTDFDGPSAKGTTTYEAAIAEYDSGSGWFINDDDQWYLAGLTYATSNNGESWYDPPDYNYAHRLSEPEIAAWINTTLEEIAIPEPATVLIFTLGGWFALRRRTI